MALMAYGPDATAHQVPVSDGASGWTMKLLTTSELDAAAGILAAQLAGSIPYSKLTLTGDVVNADIASAAAIALSKLADPGSGNVVGSTGSGAVAVIPPGTKLDATSITASAAAVTATTEGTSVAQITGNSITYDGTQVRVAVFIPQFTGGSGGGGATLVVYRDTTVVGHISAGNVTTTGGAVRGEVFDTPSAGAHTYKVAMFVSGNNVTANAGAGGAGNLVPAFLRVTKA